MNKSKIYFIIYIFVIIAVILTIFEFVILPLYYNVPHDIALIGFTGKPGTIVDDTSINSIGFTGDVILQKKDPEKVRILTLGGSAMFNRRMTERLKESFNEVSDRPVEILGAALRTHTSRSSLIKYRTLSKYNFDYVLIYHGINDLFVNNVDASRFKSDYSHMVPWYRRNVLLDHSLVARVFYNNILWGHRIFGTSSWYLKYIYPDKDIENAMNFVSVDLFRQNLSTLVTEIKQHNAVPILMTFAWNIPSQYDRKSFEAGTVGYKPTNYGRYPVELWGSVGFVREGLKRHNQVIREIAKQYNVLMIDQEKLMDKDLRWFEDVCHFSEEGTDKFVQYTTEFFSENKLF
jgi:lysophospholipase L1-like esterase